MNLCERFEKIHGYRLDLKNPQTYNEKLFWRMSAKKNCPDRIVEMADKMRLREFAKDAKLIPTANTFPMFIKANNMSGRNVFVENEKQLARAVMWILRQPRDYGAVKGEWWYQEMTPAILFQEPIKNFTELKFFCFHGRAEYLQICDGDKRSWFTREGQYLNMRSHRKKSKIKTLPDITKALKIADDLSSGIDHVRVDLLLADEIYLTEFTFAHVSGRDKWSDPEFDRKMGEKWKID